MSERQKKKSARAHLKDKWGFPMSLSKKVRTSLKNEALSRSYASGGKSITLERKAKMDGQNSILHAGGSRKCY